MTANHQISHKDLLEISKNIPRAQSKNWETLLLAKFGQNGHVRNFKDFYKKKLFSDAKLLPLNCRIGALLILKISEIILSGITLCLLLGLSWGGVYGTELTIFADQSFACVPFF